MAQHKRVAMSLADGTLRFLWFKIEGRGNILPNGAYWSNRAQYWIRMPTKENIESEIARALACPGTPALTGYRILEEDVEPLLTDREFRNALVDDGGVVKHDLEKAKVLKLASIRRKRAYKLDQLDRDWMRALGQKNMKTADDVETERQKLRDIPRSLASALDDAKTIEDVRIVTGGL